MNFDFFLCPMLIPMIIPLFYCLKYKKESFAEVVTISLSMLLIIILYWPLTTHFQTSSNILVKFILFIFLPISLLSILKFDKLKLKLKQYGIKKEGLKKSTILGLLFIPLMLIITFLVKYNIGINTEANMILGIISFIESFSEEFFFRGILFLFLINKTNLKVAYTTSFACFVLIHPQHFTNPFIISTIIQGILTIEICRRTNNLTGAWLVHGTNRFFGIGIAPFII